MTEKKNPKKKKIKNPQKHASHASVQIPMKP